MYQCRECDERFEDPCYEEVCLEDLYGVGSMFESKHYKTIATCPYCGANINTEEDYYYDDDEE